MPDASPSPDAADDRWTVRRVLDWTASHLESHGSESPRLDAEILLAHSRNCRRVQLYTQYDAELTPEERAAMRGLVKRRSQHEPVAYLVGHREFFSLSFELTKDVLIPRPDTETLVVELVDAARGLERPRILDVGTGSGCIAIAAAVNRPEAIVAAIDVSPPALQVARRNAAKHDVADRIAFLEGDLFAPLESGAQFDFIVSNPPYVSDGDFAALAEDVRRHEPASALKAGPDGLDVVRRLIAESPPYLAPGGRLMIEISPEQAPAVKDLLESSGRFCDVEMLRDLSRLDRVAGARLR